MAKRRSVPQRVTRWFNFSDPLDIVALDSDLKNDFPESRPQDASIQNEFMDNDGERNHHKSYGYLRNKKVGRPVAAFLKS